jgi:hypothetical protein
MPARELEWKTKPQLVNMDLSSDGENCPKGLIKEVWELPEKEADSEAAVDRCWSSLRGIIASKVESWGVSDGPNNISEVVTPSRNVGDGGKGEDEEGKGDETGEDKNMRWCSSGYAAES